MADTPSLFSLVINGDIFTGTLHSPAEWNDKLAEELQLQELLIASFGHSSCCTAANTLCRVCDRPTLLTEAPAKPACSHAVCSACLTLYVDHILRRNVTNVRCPISACGAVLVPDAHRELVPPKLFHRWIQAHRADSWGGGRVTDDRTRVFQRGGGKWRATLSMEGFPGEKPQRRDSSLQIFIQGEYDRDELLNLAGQALRSLGVDRNDPKGKKPVTEIGQVSGSPEFYCNICMETKESSQRFDMGSCSHAFCGSCIGQYVATRVEEKVTSIGCPSPGCKEGILDPDKCRHVVSKEVFDRWGLALCESALGQNAFYCPYRDCSALLMNDCGGEVGCRATIKASCPHCRRICCVKCKVPWHWGIGCLRSLESGNETGSMEEHMLRDLAASKNWQRCPRCRIYVERIDGCSYMKCSCGRGFCYRCGSPMAADRRCNNCNIRSPF